LCKKWETAKAVSHFLFAHALRRRKAVFAHKANAHPLAASVDSRRLFVTKSAR
jgi:hypothetical protein